MKKSFILLSVLVGLASLNSCCGTDPAPVSTQPAYVVPVK